MMTHYHHTDPRGHQDHIASTQADLLVSGDADLLDLAADDVTVLTSRELLERLQT